MYATRHPRCCGSHVCILHSQQRARERAARVMLAKDPSALAGQALLPTLNDPRLWMVMCKVRLGRGVCVCAASPCLWCAAC